jgi:cytochrome c553
MKKNILLALLLSMSAMSAFAGANTEAGKTAAAKCVACHGDTFTNPVDPSYPKLAGQHKDYLVQALKSYKRGVIGISGRNNAIMAEQAKALSDADIENIAAYLNSLPTTLVLKK